ncbi:univalents only [Musca autumnalis]|uniref:univalents only n=1 Tax=Musca autumnalis TaxID=221902 RepID=UPI003CE733BD
MVQNKNNYRIKLMAGNNVVLVEADGKESEIFVPQIDRNGRITFVNIIPQRRCCQLAESLPSQINVKQEKNNTNGDGFLLPSLGTSNQENMRPLANSTALKGERRSLTNNGGGGDTFGGSAASLPTPEPFRRAIPIQRIQLPDDRVINLPKGVKVMRLYHNRQDTPSKVGRLVSTNSSSNVNSVTRDDFHNISNMSCSFRIPSTPIDGNKANSGGVVCSTPLNKQINVSSRCDSSNSKWRKCKTPIRTYSRRGGVTKKQDVARNSAKKFNFKPTYLVNPTQAPKPSHRIVLRKRKLVVDSKVRISTRTFKKMQQEPATNSLPKATHGPSSLSFTSLQKKRKIPMSAFDLLTNPSRSLCMSKRLKEQFRNGCVNKASSTYAKYKVLCTNIPPLQNDEEVLELTRLQQSHPDYRSSAGQMTERRVLTDGTANMKLIQQTKVPNPVAISVNQGKLQQINKPLIQNQQVHNANQGILQQTNRHVIQNQMAPISKDVAMQQKKPLVQNQPVANSKQGSMGQTTAQPMTQTQVVLNTKQGNLQQIMQPIIQNQARSNKIILKQTRQPSNPVQNSKTGNRQQMRPDLKQNQLVLNSKQVPLHGAKQTVNQNQPILNTKLSQPSKSSVVHYVLSTD